MDSNTEDKKISSPENLSPLVSVPQDEQEKDTSSSMLFTRLGIGKALSLGLSSFDDVANALNSPQDEVRTAAARTLGTIEEPGFGEGRKDELVHLLKRAVNDHAWQVQVAALYALQKLNKQLQIEILTSSSLRGSKNSFVRAAIIDALATLGEQAPTGRILEALGDSEWRVRVAALRAIGRLGEKALLRHVMDALKDDDLSVQSAAIQTLGKLRGKAAKEFLEAFLCTQPDWEVQQAALLTLEQIGEQDLANSLRAALEDDEIEVSRSITELDPSPGGETLLRPLNIWTQLSEDRETKSCSGKSFSLWPISIPCFRCKVHSYGILKHTRRGWQTKESERGAQKVSHLMRFLSKGREQASQYKKQVGWGLSRAHHVFSLFLTAVHLILTVVLNSLIHLKDRLKRTWFGKHWGIIVSALFVLFFLLSALSHISTSADSLINVRPRQHFRVEVTLFNTTSTSWSSKEGYMLTCTIGRYFRTSCMGISTMSIENVVISPGQQYTFVKWLTAPSQPGYYTIQWAIEHHGTLIQGSMVFSNLFVKPPASFSHTGRSAPIILSPDLHWSCTLRGNAKREGGSGRFFCCLSSCITESVPLPNDNY